MKPIEFPEQNRVWAKDQPEYQPLPAYTDERQTITCWKPTMLERLRILLTGRIWLRQLNFGAALQPQLLEVKAPFIRYPETVADGQ